MSIVVKRLQLLQFRCEKGNHRSQANERGRVKKSCPQQDFGTQYVARAFAETPLSNDSNYFESTKAFYGIQLRVFRIHLLF